MNTIEKKREMNNLFNPSTHNTTCVLFKPYEPTALYGVASVFYCPPQLGKAARLVPFLLYTLF
jgi:hypothetical protein